MTTHLMTDTETLGTRVGSVVLSVAFVRFTDEACFQINLSVPEQQALGLEIDNDTLAWWHQREAESPGIYARATQGALPLRQGLEYIASWIEWARNGTDFDVWCHGATFDCPLLEELYRRVGIPCPWRFWQVRDTRTLYDLACINPKDYAVPPPHVALNDAIGQTRAANAALAVLARAHQAQHRYFFHPESGSLFHTDDGSFPSSDGLLQEVTANEFTLLLERQRAA